MNYESKMFFAFISTIISTILVFQGGWLSFISYIQPWIFPALVIMGIIFIRSIWACLKSFNVYTWLIIAFYLSGVITIEWGSMSMPFEGLFMTLPLILFYLYWSQKNSAFLTTKEMVSRKHLFYLDIFLISTAFLVAGLLMLIIDFNNTDLRGWWPFVIAFYILYGLGSGLVYGLISTAIQQKYHRRYTRFFSSILILILSFGVFMPRHIQIFNGFSLDSFSALLLAALFSHIAITSFLWVKHNAWTKLC
ncbi:hypothetical protein ACNVED_16670 (plasmid) [Legionella sp. D16C41]|uniref:hypothetical protein n=1 Tax=Legionella sp. D16C41 TaxID=3402688 RepID=UPI003AF88DFA